MRMGMRELESAILAEAKIVTGNNKLKKKDIMEWSTGEVKPEQGEKVYHLPDMNCNIAIKTKTETIRKEN